MFSQKCRKYSKVIYNTGKNLGFMLNAKKLQIFQLMKMSTPLQGKTNVSEGIYEKKLLVRPKQKLK